MITIGRTCLLCNSIHRKEYEQMKLNNPTLSIKDIWRYANTHYKENIPYHSFKYHFRNHVEFYIKAGVESSRLRQKKIEEEIYKDIETAKMLRETLEELNQQLSEVRNSKDPRERKEARDIIEKITTVFNLILKFHDKVQIKVRNTEEDIFDKIVDCMIQCNFSREQLMEFASKWKTSYVK